MNKTIEKITEDPFYQCFASYFEQEPICLILHNNHCNSATYHKYETLLAAGSLDSITLQSKSDLTTLDAFVQKHSGDWIVGHIAYEMLHLLEEVPQNENPFISIPLLHFAVPHTVLEINTTNEVVIHKCMENPEELLRQIKESTFTATNKKDSSEYRESGISENEYMEHVNALKKEIQQGNIYEINYCHSMHFDNFSINPALVYQLLNSRAQTPFAAWYRWNEKHLLCASPERFLAKREDKLICQPIKGTNRRLKDTSENALQIEKLKNSEKEQAENIMIVDLIRNELSRVCEPGTIQVEELCGIYPFRFVNQMISTVSGRLDKKVKVSDIFRALYPAGSMTGAPKISAMKLISKHEQFQRGIYSGAIGYMDPEGDWDFNVVIRSIVYDSQSAKASISAGGAITALSEPAAEYEESLLKLESMKDVIHLFQSKSKA